jgi:hypothetical protein
LLADPLNVKRFAECVTAHPAAGTESANIFNILTEPFFSEGKRRRLPRTG